MPTNNCTSITDQIGNTPLIQLSKVACPDGAAIYGKVEGLNPGGSIKDRVALAMIGQAEKDGSLKPGGVIVEPTSGNTGIGLAVVCARKGYRLVLTMPDTMSLERRRLLLAYGAELVLTPGNLGMYGAVEKAEELAASNQWLLPQQFKNLANPEIHRTTTAPEIISAMQGRSIDGFVAGVGTGGTITGVGEVLRKHNPAIVIAAVEPADSAVLSGCMAGAHQIQGIGAGFVPEVLNTAIYDEVIAIADEEAFEGARRLAREEGIMGGVSCGAALVAAQGLAKRLGKSRNVVVILPDSGERYMSSGLFDKH